MSAALSAVPSSGSVASLDAAIGSVSSVLAPHITKIGNQGGYLGLVGAGSPIMLSLFRDVADADNAENGSPLCKNRRLSKLGGYIKVMHGDVNASGATPSELDQIRSELESGIYYE